MIFEILKAGIGTQRRVDQLLWPAPSKKPMIAASLTD